MSLRTAYVGGVHALRGAAATTGLLGKLEASRGSRAARWARSLFAIYDIDDMVRLDLPWWTFDAIAEVEAHLAARPAARVFEYGSGASTVWLGKRAAEVVSVEHDEPWFDIVAGKVASLPHVRHRAVPPDTQPVPGYGSSKPGWQGRSFRNYVHAIDDETGTFDVIVIDGRAREACLKHAASRLAADGIVVFDNSNRQRYRAAIAASGLKARSFAGLAACLPYPDETTLLSR